MPFFGTRMKTDLFQFCGHCWVFQICWHIECSTFTASPFRIWNSSTGIPSPPLALFIVMLSRPTWLHIPGYLALGEWSYHRNYLGCEDLFCTVLTVASWPVHRFLRRQIRWSGIPISFKNFLQFVVIHTVKGFGVLSKAEVDVFLELSCFLDDPADVGNLISVSSAFSKSSLNIWKFSVDILLKPSLENFEH